MRRRARFKGYTHRGGAAPHAAMGTRSSLRGDHLEARDLPLMLSGLRTFSKRCMHCSALRSSKCSEISRQARISRCGGALPAAPRLAPPFPLFSGGGFLVSYVPTVGEYSAQINVVTLYIYVFVELIIYSCIIFGGMYQL